MVFSVYVSPILKHSHAQADSDKMMTSILTADNQVMLRYLKYTF